MRNHRLRWSRPILLVAAIGVMVWVNAGDLNPPGGPVAPTMKTLTEVEPRTIVNLVNTPSSAAALHVISQSGSYVLTGDIQGVAGKHGIHIASDNVALDLRGYSVIGVGAGSGDFDGITADQTPFVQRKNITVINGTVRNWGRDGINGIFGGSNCNFRELRLSDNGRNGLAANNATVVNCTAQNNPASGIVGYGSTVTACTAISNGQGFGSFFGGTLAHSTAISNGVGMFLGNGVVATNCSISFSTGTGLGLSGRSVVLNNNISGNTGPGIEIFFSEGGSRIEGNTVTDNGNKGINVSGGTGTIVVRNTASGNTGGNYDMGSSNSYGPIVEVTGLGDMSGTAGAEHPLANLSY